MILAKYKKYRDEKKFTQQLPDTLEALANAMKAGYSFPQALIFITNESKPPLREIFKSAVEKIEYNFSIKEVLKHLKKTASHNDMDLVIDGILIQHKIGGNIIEMLEKTTSLIRERVKLQNDIKAFTAQGRFSGILISLLCPISLIMFYIISPEYIGIMFETFLGKSLLLTALILEIIGFKLIWNITNIKL